MPGRMKNSLSWPQTALVPLRTLFYFRLTLLTTYLLDLPKESFALAIRGDAASSGQNVAQSSSELWAGVVANVTPLMTLVGERNAKEYLRMASSWHHFWPLATAPLGILSIMISAIRLSGAPALRRIFGRESDRRSEALIELTPLSVAPATSVYTSRAVEIEPAYVKDRIAFICGHVPMLLSEVACAGFRDLYSRKGDHVANDRDYELVLSIWDVQLGLQEAVQLVEYINGSSAAISTSLLQQTTGLPSSLGFRTCGISPTQTTKSSESYTGRVRDLFAGIVFIIATIGVQIIGWSRSDKTKESLQALLMGTIGYGAIVLFTGILLFLIKTEVVAEETVLPPLFKDALWTFSDSRHAEHQAMDPPKQNTLVIARPAVFSSKERAQRESAVLLTCIGLSSAYVVYYLGLRVNFWWVGISILGIVWLGAAYRSMILHNALVATEKSITGESWTGAFQDSFTETLEVVVNDPDPTSASTANKTSAARSGNCLLLVANPYRMGLRTWTGSEDIMKVGLEVGKRLCKDMTCQLPSENIKGGRWPRLVRLHCKVYVPGMVWTSQNHVDFAMGKQFDLDHLIRDLYKLLYVSLDQNGTISRHTVDQSTRQRLESALAIPIPDIESLHGDNITLRELIRFLRDCAPGYPHKHIHHVEHITLMPTLILAAIYDRWFMSHPQFGKEIERLQGKHVDKLACRGASYIHAVEDQFRQHNLAGDFMKEHNQEEVLVQQPRDFETADDYSTFNTRLKHMDMVQPLGEDGLG